MAEPQIPLTLVDWLDDLCVRFLLNLPQSELSSVPRLCFQVEEAQWYYEDFVRPAVQASGAPPLPHLPLRQFCLLIFQHCPLLSGFTDAQHLAAYEDFLSYKVRVPVRGAILLDQSMEKLVLVRGWKKGASWSFPRGKINKDERDLDCAIREVYEETGFDLSTSGLIPESEDDLKYIDVTMREQHMRLFVVRGVPEDTYFETKTRKEISKIQWYWIKDLPGFKKQSKQQQQFQHQSEAEVAHANKFYMVAPFLGPLKKWISQQRKQDMLDAQRRVSATQGLPTVEQHIGIEDESEDPYSSAHAGVSVAQREADLRRLLSVGATQASMPNPAIPSTHPGNLLAMLQGGAQPVNGQTLPRTPFDQINAFPSQPETPQPRHPRQPSIGQYQSPPPPQFPFSPQRLEHEQQRPPFQPFPNVFGSGSGPVGYPPGPPSGMLPPQAQLPAFSQGSSFPTSMPSDRRPNMPFNNAIPPVQLPQMPVHQQFQNTPPPGPLMAEASQGAIGGGPAIPNASQLPAPNLNPHTMKLLDAFKGGNNKPTQPTNTSARPSPGPTTTHQAALLSLFNKSSASTPPAVQPTSAPAEDEPVSPALTNVTEKPTRPSKAQERKPTLNEITRTLPLKPKVKSTPSFEPPAVTDRSSDERPKSRQLFDPNQPEKNNNIKPKPQLGDQGSPVRILQRPSSKQGSRSPQPKPAAISNSPSMKDSAGKENSHQAPQFTILTRPGSSKSSIPPAPASPLKNETSAPTFQPQLLKRLQTFEAERENSPREVTGTGKLMALLGQTPTPTSTDTPGQLQTNNLERNPSASTDSKTAFLDLLGASSQQQPASSPAPPSAPKLQPSSKSNEVPTAGAANKHNVLLDLLKNPSSNPTLSPSSPISPFTLGTPVTAQAPSSRLGSIASNLAASPTSGAPGGATTPVEAKEFLMGYLNGVVSEGYRSSGAQK